MASQEIDRTLVGADLVIDKVYRGEALPLVGADPIHVLLPGTGNQGGFRVANREANDGPCYVVLFSTGGESEWPDYLDIEHGYFRYFGDNRQPGKDLHDTPKGGNRFLKEIFGKLAGSEEDRRSIPPFFLFRKVPDGTKGRPVQFLGLAGRGGVLSIGDRSPTSPAPPARPRPARWPGA